jgi:hypothetical protein
MTSWIIAFSSLGIAILMDVFGIGSRTLVGGVFAIAVVSFLTASIEEAISKNQREILEALSNIEDGLRDINRNVAEIRRELDWNDESHITFASRLLREFKWWDYSKPNFSTELLKALKKD